MASRPFSKFDSGFPICTPSIALMRIKTWNNTHKYFQVLPSTLKIKVGVLRVANLLEGIIFFITMYKLCAGARNTTVFPRKKHASKKPTGWGKKQYGVVFFPSDFFNILARSSNGTKG